MNNIKGISLMILLLMPLCSFSQYKEDVNSSTSYRRIITVAAGVTALSFLADNPVNNFNDKKRTPFLDNLTDVTQLPGDKYIAAPALLLCYTSARFTNNKTLQQTSLKSAQAFITASIATGAIKYSAGRARPSSTYSSNYFSPFKSGDEYRSLPSGHAATAFSILTPFAETYSKWLYTIPAATALSRCYKNEHWLSDVVTGSAIGFLSGYLLTHNKNIELIPSGLRLYF
ncbi:phosphatase PAP2 family protein [Marinilabiliaceae bacterium ANBcel2]|nr:phosphatase PAP2 family protein [Marinilabiliaceae bacterium ANBcel2]